MITGYITADEKVLCVGCGPGDAKAGQRPDAILDSDSDEVLAHLIPPPS